MRKTLFAAASFGLVLVAGCVQPIREELVVKRSWPAAGVTQLNVNGTNGKVSIDATPNTTEITMVANCRVPKGKTEADIMTTEVSGDVLRVSEKNRSHRHFIFGTGDSVRIDYEFHVPVNLRVQVDNVNGRIDVEGVDGKMELTTVNGGIEVSTPKGELVARTVNGSVRADFLEKFSGARLKTVNGSVRIRVPRDCTVNPEVHQVNGSFRSDIPVTINSSSSAEGSLEVTTVNGSVTLSELGGHGSVPDTPEPPEPPALPEPPAGK